MVERRKSLSQERKAGTTYIDENGYLRYINSEGCEMDWQAAVNLMDEEIRDRISRDTLEGLSVHEYFETYARLHEEKFGEIFELTKGNPTF